MAVRMGSLEEKNRRLSAGLSNLDYPEAEATVPIHPETPTSGHPHYCILLAKSTVESKFNRYKHLLKIQLDAMSLVLRFSEGNGRGNFKFCRYELRHSARSTPVDAKVTFQPQLWPKSPRFFDERMSSAECRLL